MDLRTRSPQLFKAALQRGMRHRFNFNLTRLIAEEHQNFEARQILASCLPPLARQLADTVLADPFAGSGIQEPGACGGLRGAASPHSGGGMPSSLSNDSQYRGRRGLLCHRPCSRLPLAMMYVFGGEAGRRRRARRSRELNGVADRILVRGWCMPQVLAKCPLGPETFVIIDCESCEYDVLLPAAVPGLKSYDLLVELHRRRDIRPHARTLRCPIRHDAPGPVHSNAASGSPRTYPELARLKAEQREALFYGPIRLGVSATPLGG
jgi:hypothetical protein